MTNLSSDPLENLELLAAGCMLAPDVYYARGEAFGVAGDWSRLTASERQWWIDVAIELLVKLEPGRMIPFPTTVRGESWK